MPDPNIRTGLVSGGHVTPARGETRGVCWRGLSAGRYGTRDGGARRSSPGGTRSASDEGRSSQALGQLLEPSATAAWAVDATRSATCAPILLGLPVPRAAWVARARGETRGVCCGSICRSRMWLVRGAGSPTASCRTSTPGRTRRLRCGSCWTQGRYGRWPDDQPQNQPHERASCCRGHSSVGRAPGLQA